MKARKGKPYHRTNELSSAQGKVKCDFSCGKKCLCFEERTKRNKNTLKIVLRPNYPRRVHSS